MTSQTQLQTTEQSKQGRLKPLTVLRGCGHFMWWLSLIFPIGIFFVMGVKLSHLSFEELLSSLGDVSFIYFVFFGWVPLLGLLGFWLMQKSGGTEGEILKAMRVSYFLISFFMASHSFFFFYTNYSQSCGPFLLKALDSIRHHVLTENQASGKR